MLVIILRIIIAALGFGLLVLIHELGHFLVAKVLKMDVEAFSFGFGPHIGRKWRGTEYRLSLVPFGGYVKLVGEEREEGRAPTPHEFLGRPPWQRACVFAAGSLMNGALAFVGFIIAFGVGVPTPPAIIGDVIPGNPAWQAGLQANDRIVAVGSLHTELDFSDIQVASLLASPGKPIYLAAERNGKRMNFQVVPEYNAAQGVLTMGVGPKRTLNIAALVTYNEQGQFEFLDDPNAVPPKGYPICPAYDAGLRVNDTVTEVNSEKLDGPGQFITMLMDCKGETMHVAYRRDGVSRDAYIQPAALGEWLIGIVYGSTTVKAVRTGSWADKVGLKKDDMITRVNDRDVTAQSQLKEAISASKDDIALTVFNSATRVITITHEEAAQLTDVVCFEPKDIVDRLIPGFPAAAAGIAMGDRIISLDGESPTDLEAQAERAAKSNGESISVAWQHAGARKSADIEPQRLWVGGLAFSQLEETKKLGLWPACVVGTRKALRWIPRIYDSFRRLLTGSISSKHVQGPISIAMYTYESAKRGLGTFAYFLAFFSLNLALLNLLPIPVLDGGHLVFAAIEKIKGSPVSERIQAVTAYVGLVLLVALMLFATFNDARSLLGL